MDPRARRRWELLHLEQQRRFKASPGLLLSSVAVSITSQRTGLGTRLLEQVHALADFHSVPVTTGTAEPAVLPWLIRGGYVVKADLTDLEHGPRYWFLERPPA